MSKPAAREPLNRIAIYPGTFDPITNGHLDIIERGSRLFDELIVAILGNSEKAPMFPLEERVALIQQTVAGLPNVKVETFAELLVTFARDKGARVIVRGLRAITDFEYEFQMALMNRRLDGDVETVFMMAADCYSYLSSRLVKEVAALGGDVSGLVPPPVARAMARRRPHGGAHQE